MTSRPSGLYPDPSAPPMDEGYYGSPARGVIRPRSESPFVRNVKQKSDEEEMEAVSCLLDFSMRPPSTRTAITPTRNSSLKS